jgi:phosphoribosyl-AMP cyclohydrolase
MKKNEDLEEFSNVLKLDGIEALNWKKAFIHVWTEKSSNQELKVRILPVAVQNSQTLEILMLGFVSQESLKISFETKHLTFFSRSKNRNWTKGETSGNYLELNEIKFDCDKDSLLASVLPKGNTCHTGSRTCFMSECEK